MSWQPDEIELVRLAFRHDDKLAELERAARRLVHVWSRAERGSSSEKELRRAEDELKQAVRGLPAT